MKFRITRTSSVADREPPVDGAEKVTIPNKTLDGRDNPMDAWVVEVESLEDLIVLVEEHGDIIVSRSKMGYDDPEYDLEIYDGYRE